MKDGRNRPEDPGAEPESAPDLSFLEDPEEMRRSGYLVVDAIVDRWTRLGEGPAWQSATRRATEALLDGPPPEKGRDLEELLEVILRDILPLASRIDHPRFFAFIPSSPTWASVLASFLVTGHNVFQGTWLASSGPSQIELTVTNWIREWMGYPEGAGGLFTSGGSVANLVAVAAAREASGNPERGTLYLSEQAHGSVTRAARTLGIPPALIRTLPADDAFRTDPGRLRETIRQDRARGLNPFCVVGNAGATNTGAIDPLDEMANVARDEGLWYHIDGAYGGFAVFDPETRPLLKGLERSDSLTLDPHKWFFQPYETGCLLARDVTRLESAFRIMPEYMQDTDWGPENVNFCDRGIQLTRIFRALRVWLSIHRYGLAAHREEISRAIALARQTEARIREERALELLAPPSLGILCFRYRGDESLSNARLDELNERIQRAVVEPGFAMISSTRLRGRFSLRFCILNIRTTQEDLDRTLDRILELGQILGP